MAYYYRESDLGSDVPHSRRFPRILVEYQKRPRDTDEIVYYRTNARNAHAWVKNGNLHATLLYVDEGRIRRAG